MNHWGKKAGIMNLEGQMIPLPPPIKNVFTVKITCFLYICVDCSTNYRATLAWKELKQTEITHACLYTSITGESIYRLIVFFNEYF